MARMSLPTPTLHTARLRLRPFTGADADALYALNSSDHVLRYWDAPPWSDRARAERFITACRQMAEDGSGARLAIDDLSDGAFIGWCSLTRWNPDHRSASMGYCLDDAAWGHGYATEGARALLQWAFDTLDLNRVRAETDPRNAGAFCNAWRLLPCCRPQPARHSGKRRRLRRPYHQARQMPWSQNSRKSM